MPCSATARTPKYERYGDAGRAEDALSKEKTMRRIRQAEHVRDLGGRARTRPRRSTQRHPPPIARALHWNLGSEQRRSSQCRDRGHEFPQFYDSHVKGVAFQGWRSQKRESEEGRETEKEGVADQNCTCLPLSKMVLFPNGRSFTHTVTQGPQHQNAAYYGARCPPGPRIMAEFLSTRVYQMHAQLNDSSFLDDGDKAHMLPAFLPSSTQTARRCPETTSSANAWATWSPELTRRQGIMRKLQREIDTVMPDQAIPRKLHGMEYLNVFIKEGSLKYGAGVEDFVLLGYVLPPGTIVSTQAWLIDCDPTVFPSPRLFSLSGGSLPTPHPRSSLRVHKREGHATCARLYNHVQGCGDGNTVDRVCAVSSIQSASQSSRILTAGLTPCAALGVRRL
ncbi:hypothetical protein FB45DRAFT_873761 [Roridomyces roridus]|uniref:Uncharacterized protein n=1 Tax=Roridomyces roridus TaxID=1738132 RepID=A0AAD7FF36_9AGAR|nr:hypothetical protein FB45DRAFT_873761 [Roridomyces roridus]